MEPGEKGQPKSEGRDVPMPVLANREATQRVSDAAQGQLSKTLDSTGKVLAILAGLGVFFVAAGYFVEWQRFRQGGLPSEQVLPLIPKDQIAAAGVRELVISLLFVALSLLLLGFAIVRLADWARGREGRAARLLSRMLAKDIAFPTAIVGGLTLLIVPFDGSGLLVAAFVTGLFLYGLLLIRRFLRTEGSDRFPLWQLVIAAGLAAIALAGARQAEYSEIRPDALVCLADGTSFEGDYIASDSDKILLRKRARSPDKQRVVEREAAQKRRIGLECAGTDGDARETGVRRRLGKRPRLIVIPRDGVEEVLFVKKYSVLPYENSLLGRIVSGVPWLPEIELSCIPPECRWRKARIGPSSYL